MIGVIPGATGGRLVTLARWGRIVITMEECGGRATISMAVLTNRVGDDRSFPNHVWSTCFCESFLRTYYFYPLSSSFI